MDLGEDEVEDVLNASIKTANQTTAKKAQSAWHEVIEWLTVSWIFQRAAALDAVSKDHELREGQGSRASVAFKNRTNTARRWIIFVHAVGDLVFLPLIMDKMRRYHWETLGAMMEMVQTGDDHRPRGKIEELWRDRSRETALRNAARYAAKCVIPIDMGYMVEILAKLAETIDPVLERRGVLYTSSKRHLKATTVKPLPR
ncbi:unnamed protein product [Tilletia caries]|nr:unnamed protein product [Tilletia caries]